MESPSSSRFAEAIERRLSSQQSQGPSPAELAAEHAKRQKFRRLIDPGILRPNPEPQAVESMKILYKLSENLLREPENSKFQRIKTTNSHIQKHIMNPKGTVEYLRELGFHPEVVEFQPYLVFNPKHMSDLKVGAAMLKESLEIQEQKKARATVSKQTVQEARAEVVEKVQLAFMEDRRVKMEQDERERRLRAARAEIAAHNAAHERIREGTHLNADDEDAVIIPGGGHVLGSPADQPPPPYNQ